MGFIKESNYQYYDKKQTFNTTAGQKNFELSFDENPSSVADFSVSVDGVEIDKALYTYSDPIVTITSGLAAGRDVTVYFFNKKSGAYRFIKFKDLVNNFMVAYVGHGKIIDIVKRSDVIFHCRRAIQEFSYDISIVEKTQEFALPPSLSIPMPQDYVKYTEIAWIDSSGLKHPILPFSMTVRPSETILQGDEYDYLFSDDGNIISTDSVTNENFSKFNSNDIIGAVAAGDFRYNTDYSELDTMFYGGRYGLDPSKANSNGGFVIDEANGKISFTSELSGRTIILSYISDGMGDDEEMKVSKLAEEAVYKYVAHAILSTKINVQEYIVERFKKERRAAMRNAKIRLSNYNIKEFTQLMKGKAKTLKS